MSRCVCHSFSLLTSFNYLLVSPTAHLLLDILGYILAAWLHLTCGISHTTTAQILKFVETIINVANTPSSSLNPSLPIISGHSNHSFSLPHNVHTVITTLSIQPQIMCYIYCPKCFYYYSLKELAKFCTWHETSQSRPYGEKLWTLQSTHSGSKLVSQWLYNVQVFSSWLETFLSHSKIKDLID